MLAGRFESPEETSETDKAGWREHACGSRDDQGKTKDKDRNY